MVPGLITTTAVAPAAGTPPWAATVRVRVPAGPMAAHGGAHTPDGGVIGGPTALALYELCDVNPRRIDVVVPVGYRPRKAGGDRYRVRHGRLGPRDVDIVEDIPVVVPAVAIAQAIGDHIDPRLIEQAIATARRRGDLDVGGEEWLREHQASELTRLVGRVVRT